MTDKQIKALRDRIVAAGIKQTYIGDLPSLKLECVSLKLVDGYPSTRYFGATDLSEPLVEVLIRTEKYQTGADYYRLITKALDRFSDAETGIISCLLTGSPGYLGRDLNGFGEWHMLFHVTTN